MTRDFSDVDPGALLDILERRLAWSTRRIDLPADLYEVLLEPSCTADLALEAYAAMTRRDADEGRSAFSSPSGGTRLVSSVPNCRSLLPGPGACPPGLFC